MEGDLKEATREELRQWIRERVMEKELVPSGALDKLQSLLERREKQVALLLRLSQSVTACESVVDKLYSVMGLKEDDVRGADTGTSSPPCESINSETQGCHSQAAIGPTSHLSPKRPDSQHLNRDNGKNSLALRQSVVVLTRLSLSEIRAYCRPKSPKHRKKKELSSVSDSDDERKSEDNSSKPPSKKKRRMDRTSPTEPKDRTNNNAAREVVNTTSELRKPSGSDPSDSSDEDTEAPPSKPQSEFSVNKRVLAKRGIMNWQHGKISQVITKENGHVKYKINFEDKGKRLVSAHHIAFDYSSKVQQLFVGARVVIKTQEDPPQFCPGVLAELACRRNKMRFLVFFDDHNPVYVTLPVIHLVCKPLKNPWDDIENSTHREFMKLYLEHWPAAPLAHYGEGRKICAELDGDQQECKVLEVDSSLIKVVFKVDQHEEWIYRGSPRLDHLKKMWKNLNSRSKEKQKIK